MSCTIEKILTDAKTLLERLKEHDTAADSLIDQSAVLHQRVAAMREAGAAWAEKVPGGAAERPDPARLRPHVLLSQENTQIRDLQQENRELWVSLEEHQDALELIMSKYRKQMLQLLQGRKGEGAEPVLKVHRSNSLEIESQIDRIREMGEVMRKAIQVDDDQFFKVQEKLAQLEVRTDKIAEDRASFGSLETGLSLYMSTIYNDQKFEGGQEMKNVICYFQVLNVCILCIFIDIYVYTKPEAKDNL
ncbi:suppressor of IKBKE 1 isoform X1 [Falco peregrinus]|uniref:suppressor of IKBKE 1 isoform X1 n=1 Tax=Falco peregrinus TaxID=8954 RepID=UPI00247AE4B4|nr:suppressor of IKBKE 1 isoform X1 [Falco peregrinus]